MTRFVHATQQRRHIETDRNWKKVLRNNTEFAGPNFAVNQRSHSKWSQTSSKSNFPYHSKSVQDYVLRLDWKILRRDFESQCFDFRKAVASSLQQRGLPLELNDLIADYSADLWEGSWFSSGEIFLRFYSENQFIGVFGVLYVLIGEVCGDFIQFHQYPKNLPRDDARVTICGKMNLTNRKIQAQYKFETRNEWKNLSLIRDPSAERKMFIGATSNDIDLLKKCIRQGMDVNMSSKEQQSHTPLTIATVCNHLDAVQYLLKNKADPNLQNESGCSALELARIRNYDSIVALLEKELNNAESKT